MNAGFITGIAFSINFFYSNSNKITNITLKFLSLLKRKTKQHSRPDRVYKSEQPMLSSEIAKIIAFILLFYYIMQTDSRKNY